MGVRLPPEVVSFLAGEPVVGTAEQVIPLLTVDRGGFPHACLLSRAQLHATEDEVRLAVASAGTSANLSERRVALVLVTIGDTVHHCKLAVRRLAEHGHVLGVACEPVAHKADSLGIPLGAMTFVATAEIAEFERWDDTAALLASL